MFNKTDDKNSELEMNSHNTIGAGTIIKGEIIIEGNVRIDGTIEGNVSSKGRIVLGKSGSIIGEVECQSSSIAGEIKGKFITHDLISLKSSAKVEGDVYYGKIEVDKGAVLNGSLFSKNAPSSINNSKKSDHKKIVKEAQELISN